MSENTNTEIVVAGAIAAFTIDMLIYPMDTIKTRYQSQDYLKTFASSGSAKKPPWKAFRGLYQGVGSVIIATLPAAGVFFTTYESAKHFYGHGASLLAHSALTIPQPLIHALASATAELASCVIITPAEVIKQNAQMLRGSSGKVSGFRVSTSMEALRMIQRSEGGAWRRMWSGYTALSARNLPMTAIQFPLFEFLRARLWRWREGSRSRENQGQAQRRTTGSVGVGEVPQGTIQEQAGTSAGMLLETGLLTGSSAALSGALAAFLTTPTDVVKTRMMLIAGGDGGSDTAAPDLGKDGGRRRRHTGSVAIAREIFKERGTRGLFRGGVLRATWTAVGSGLYLGSYEVAKLWLRDGRGDDDGEP